MNRIILCILICLSLFALTSCEKNPNIPLPAGTVADRVVIEKSARRLILYAHGEPLKYYRVALGRSPIGPKVRQGDNKTPEGLYAIDGHKKNSLYHLALHISYPNASDIARAKSLGVPPGGDIMIHGITNWLGWVGRLHRRFDWTRGCIAVTDWEIEEIWRVVPDGTVVEIKP